ncbi:ArsR family transcriptional regulator [Kribbella italica]|uniref:DNA-binding transcriptional ArsR family regulator n=1 Tax=Kribbella italica TaxID=1540520 RepID=A0A7W9JDM0_9ACTN|nr:DNA-binding transcriptional ArsR family regulator [Kribbella italica]
MEEPVDNRLADLERRVAALESAESAGLRPQERQVLPQGADPEVFFALRGLKERIPAPGAVLYTGSVTLPDERTIDWQFGRPTPEVLEADWASRASALAALGHPVRLTLLREILHGRTTVSALSEVEGLGTSGQIYHHLRQLTAEGWLHTPSRGVFAVPPTRVVALLAILVALER